MKNLARFLFKIFGWIIEENSPEGVRKCVIVVGPHTSNWDFVLGRLAFILYGIREAWFYLKGFTV